MVLPHPVSPATSTTCARAQRTGTPPAARTRPPVAPVPPPGPSPAVRVAPRRAPSAPCQWACPRAVDRAVRVSTGRLGLEEYGGRWIALFGTGCHVQAPLPTKAAVRDALPCAGCSFSHPWEKDEEFVCIHEDQCTRAGLFHWVYDSNAMQEEEASARPLGGGRPTCTAGIPVSPPPPPAMY